MMLLENTLDTFIRDTERPIAVPPLPAPPAKSKRHRQKKSVPAIVNRMTPYLARSVASDLRLFQTSPRKLRNKRRLIGAYIDDCDRLHQTAATIKKFFYDTVFSSLVYGGPKGQERQGVENTLLNATEMIAQTLDAPLVPQALENRC